MLAWEIRPAQSPSPIPCLPQALFFRLGKAREAQVCSAHWGVWGAHHSSVGCTGGSSPAAAEGWVWHWARGVQKQQHQPFCQSFLPQSPTGQRQCQQISRNAGLEGKSGSLRGTLQTVGISPQRSFPEPLETTAGPQWLQAAKHHHHFTLPK